jgi:hypothetical protein
VFHLQCHHDHLRTCRACSQQISLPLHHYRTQHRISIIGTILATTPAPLPLQHQHSRTLNCSVTSILPPTTITINITTHRYAERISSIMSPPASPPPSREGDASPKSLKGPKLEVKLLPLDLNSTLLISIIISVTKQHCRSLLPSPIISSHMPKFLSKLLLSHNIVIFTMSFIFPTIYCYCYLSPLLKLLSPFSFLSFLKLSL